MTNRRIMAINYYKAFQQLPLQEIRSFGVRSEWMIFGGEHVVYFDVASNARFGGYAREPWSGVFCKSRKDADALAAKIQEALGLTF